MLPVGAAVLPPLSGRVKSLEDSCVCRGLRQRPWTTDALGMKVQFAHRTERFDRLSHAGNRDHAQQDRTTCSHWGTT
jgi:hypothetical protein